jgi:hypothetical protein
VTIWPYSQRACRGIAVRLVGEIINYIPRPRRRHPVNKTAAKRDIERTTLGCGAVEGPIRPEDKLRLRDGWKSMGSDVKRINVESMRLGATLYETRRHSNTQRQQSQSSQFHNPSP